MKKQFLSIFVMALIALVIGVVETVLITLNTDALYPVFMAIIPSFLILAVSAEKLARNFCTIRYNA